MGVDISIDGIGDLVDQLELMSANVKAVIDSALKAAAEPILADARKTTAFKDRSGDLRKSLTVTKTKIKGGQKFVLVGAFNTGAFYAFMVEYGTTRAKAYPFLAPAFERHREEAYLIIKERLTEALK